jgi:hypothetical protein
MEPSAKGTIVMGVVATLRKARKTGQLAPEQLAARLSAAALELFEQKIEPARWYPMPPFVELVEFEWDVLAQRNPDYARQAGALSAERQFESGRYQQMDFAKRAKKAESTNALLLQARLITTITSAFYSFLDTTVGIDPARPDKLEIVYANAAMFPEPLRFATEGFMNQLNVRQGSKRLWTSERVAPERIVFQLPLPGRLLR